MGDTGENLVVLLLTTTLFLFIYHPLASPVFGVSQPNRSDLSLRLTFPKLNKSITATSGLPLVPSCAAPSRAQLRLQAPIRLRTRWHRAHGTAQLQGRDERGCGEQHNAAANSVIAPISTNFPVIKALACSRGTHTPNLHLREGFQQVACCGQQRWCHPWHFNPFPLNSLSTRLSSSAHEESLLAPVPAGWRREASGGENHQEEKTISRVCQRFREPGSSLTV